MITALFFLATLGSSAPTPDFPRVDADLKIFDDHVTELNRAFDEIPANPMDREWVKRKLSHMFDVDQYARVYFYTTYDHQYSAEERNYFMSQFLPRLNAVDAKDISDLKSLLKIYSWINVSEFGARADNDAWLIVQHADQDLAFQKEMLTVLANQYPIHETRPDHYAYLFDRVATNENRPQLYGTQGQCTGPGTWEPKPIENPSEVDQRRANFGMEPMAEYLARFKTLCR